MQIRSNNLRTVLISTLLALFSSRASAQVGVDLCACQPSVYTFTFNFSLTCEDQNLGEDSLGIFETECSIVPVGAENATDLMPARVTSLQILELDQNLQVLVQTTVTSENGAFVDGDSFQYVSILSPMFNPSLEALPGATYEITSTDLGGGFNSTTLPRGFQITITAENGFDEFVRNAWIVLYDNDCGLFPLLFEDDQAGWTVIVRVSPRRLFRHHSL